jgi:hypothetical protein
VLVLAGLADVLVLLVFALALAAELELEAGRLPGGGSLRSKGLLVVCAYTEAASRVAAIATMGRLMFITRSGSMACSTHDGAFTCT